MKVFLLERANFSYDEIFRKVIVANNEQRARKIANLETADEGKIWEDSAEVSCTIINLEIEGEIASVFLSA